MRQAQVSTLVRLDTCFARPAVCAGLVTIPCSLVSLLLFDTHLDYGPAMPVVCASCVLPPAW